MDGRAIEFLRDIWVSILKKWKQWKHTPKQFITNHLRVSFSVSIPVAGGWMGAMGRKIPNENKTFWVGERGVGVSVPGLGSVQGGVVKYIIANI